MNNYFLIDSTTGAVVNQIVLSPDSEWPVPEGHFLMAVEPAPRKMWAWDGADWVVQSVPGQFATIGDVWDGAQFVAPDSPKPPPPPSQPTATGVEEF